METPALLERSPPAQEIKPIVVVSQCLGFAAVRYNGQILQDAFVQALTGHVRFIQVCPEVGMGLGVPRDPIRIVVEGVQRRLVQPATGRDLTAAMAQFANGFLSGLQAADGFILKSRSPSCGIKDVKTFSENGHPSAKSTGFFADAVQRRFPCAAVEDEGRLTNYALRHHFLVRLFAGARLREIGEQGEMADLVEFHTRYKLQLMACSQTGLKVLGRIVANPERRPWAEILQSYLERWATVTGPPARPTSIRNALQHAFGYVSDQLTGREKKYFAALLEDYRWERVPLTAILSVLQSWVIRFEQPYLLGQHFFEPYPKALMELTDSGSGRSQL